MALTSNMSEIFTSFQEYLKHDQEIREEIRSQVREIEQLAREIITGLQAVHQPVGLKNISTICQTARNSLKGIEKYYAGLESKIPDGQYYRFHDHWKFVSQRLVFICALIVYLETESLITKDETAAMLGVKSNKEDGFHIDLDDFLMGLLLVASELSRLAVNSVTAGDYTRPVRIGSFVGDLDSGFRLLNLKNDALRKRFDGLKYDIKKIEEVIYDLSIRGLLRNHHDDEASTAATPAEAADTDQKDTKS
ncbi:translin-like [Tubulanus polymorphus]|uniref:translin-like n=1 Tax=Tubulanus polymorphus TaxID=672921 RepID=UPI003DA1D8A0